MTVVTRERLTECERVIERGLGTFIEVGEALLEIRRDRLYLDGHDTFEGYCRERWGFSRRTGYDLMQTAEVAGSVQEVAHAPTREAARELAPLRSEPGRMREAWSEAVEEYGEKPTAGQVREIVRPASRPPRLAAVPEPGAEDAEARSKRRRDTRPRCSMCGAIIKPRKEMM